MLDNDASDRPRRRTALVDLELENINVDVAALQEVRLSGEGQIREAGRTFFWKGYPEGEPRRAGVAFAIRNELADKLSELPVGISERIMKLRIKMASNRCMTLINVYAPTMTYPDEEKEAFYSQLREITRNVPQPDKLILVGDFNARVGNDHRTWGSVLGKFGKGQQNPNGELLTCLCAELDLAITNTYFYHRENQFYTWFHPRSKRGHLLDYVITRRRDLHEVKNTRAMRGPDCLTDHYIVKSTLKIAVKPIYSKQKSHRKRKLDTKQLNDPARQEHLQQEIARALGEIQNEESLQKTWEILSSRVYSAAVETLGYTKKRNTDWFDENNQIIKLAIDERNRALMAKLSNPTEWNKQKLKLARKNLQ